MKTQEMPSRPEWLAAFLRRDPAYDGVFYAGVRTTGIFCRSTCPARKPLPDNVVFFSTTRDAVVAGFRPCRRCTPLDAEGAGGGPLLSVAHLPTPLGPMVAAAGNGALWLLEFTDRRRLPTQTRLLEERHGCRFAPGSDPILMETARQLHAYFAGTLKAFTVPTQAPGTRFQVRVWRELTAIPWGRRVTYAELAERVGHPGAARAVGTANGYNRIAIVLPCHRVVGGDGRLTGYGGGIWRKRRLLELEGGEDLTSEGCARLV